MSSQQEFNIDPDFSVYQLVQRVIQTSAMLHHRKTMTLISYEIENATIVDGAHTVIFSGFQRYSRFLTQLERYERLARQAQVVYVFGVPDVRVPAIPNVVYVPLQPSDELSKEWFVVSYGKEYFSALATSELTYIEDPDDSRVFEGLWTFDLDLVEIIFEWLCNTVNYQGERLDETQHNLDTQVKLMSNSVGRLLISVMQEQNTRMAAVIQAELKSIIKDGIYSAFETLSSNADDDSFREQDVVVLFSDLRNFTSIANDMSARELVENIINPYMQIVSQCVYRYGGEVDKFLGDGVLAVFGMRHHDEGNPQRALAAAQEIMTELAKLPTQPPVGIGIDAGQVVVGEIGISGAHTEETVIGDAVNTAQRLSSLGVNDIWVSDRVASQLGSEFTPSQQMMMNLKGKSSPQAVYRVRL